MLITWTFFIPETYAPTLLARKASQLQKRADEADTGEHFISKYDKVKKPIKQIVKVGLARPLTLLFTEIIVLTLSLYCEVSPCVCSKAGYWELTDYDEISIGHLWRVSRSRDDRESTRFLTRLIVYTSCSRPSQSSFDNFDIGPVRRSSAMMLLRHTLADRGSLTLVGLSGLAIVGVGIGMIIGFFMSKINAVYYAKARARIPAHLPVPPEIRLPTMCIGAVLVPTSLFIFAWTCTPNVPWIVCILASVPFGTGYLLIFGSILAYLIDSYPIYAASALAANAVLRALFGAAFPLFASYLFNGLGTHWAGTRKPPSPLLLPDPEGQSVNCTWPIHL